MDHTPRPPLTDTQYRVPARRVDHKHKNINIWILFQGMQWRLHLLMRGKPSGSKGPTYLGKRITASIGNAAALALAGQGREANGGRIRHEQITTEEN